MSNDEKPRRTMGERCAEAWGQVERREPEVYALVERVQATLREAAEELTRLGNRPTVDAKSPYRQLVQVPLYQQLMQVFGAALEGLYNAEFGAAMRYPEVQRAEKAARVAQLVTNGSGGMVH